MLTSPAAQMFWGSLIRHSLTAVGTVLVAHGWASQATTASYTEELVGLALNGAVLVWSNRTAYWQRIKMLVAQMLPPHSTENDVNAKIALGVVPSVFTPANTIPGVPK